MGEHSAIEWTDHTFNPWEGCTRVSPGCANCYAEARDRRFTGGAHWGPGAPRRVTSPANWKLPLRWNRAAEKAGVRYKVFCGSLCDVFDPEAPEGAWAWLRSLIIATPHLDWLLLTKRPENITGLDPLWIGVQENVWLGTTVESPDQLHRVDDLLKIPARVRFLSVEPMLGPVDLASWLGHRYDHGGMVHECSGVDWVICGGESGPKARPMHPDWARSLRDQCAEAGVPFLLKQWGEWGLPRVTRPSAPGRFVMVRDEGSVEVEHFPRSFTSFGAAVMQRVGKKAAGRLLDGVEHSEFPEGGIAR